MLMIFYVFIPIVLSTLYVKNMQGQLRSCFLYSEDFEVIGKVDNMKEKRSRSRGQLMIQCVLLILSIVLMIIVTVVFLTTENNLNKMESNSAILKIHFLRYVLSVHPYIAFNLEMSTTAYLEAELRY